MAMYPPRSGPRVVGVGSGRATPMRRQVPSTSPQGVRRLAEDIINCIHSGEDEPNGVVDLDLDVLRDRIVTLVSAHVHSALQSHQRDHRSIDSTMANDLQSLRDKLEEYRVRYGALRKQLHEKDLEVRRARDERAAVEEELARIRRKSELAEARLKAIERDPRLLRYAQQASDGGQGGGAPPPTYPRSATPPRGSAPSPPRPATPPRRNGPAVPTPGPASGALKSDAAPAAPVSPRPPSPTSAAVDIAAAELLEAEAAQVAAEIVGAVEGRGGAVGFDPKSLQSRLHTLILRNFRPLLAGHDAGFGRGRYRLDEVDVLVEDAGARVAEAFEFAMAEASPTGLSAPMRDLRQAVRALLVERFRPHVEAAAERRGGELALDAVAALQDAQAAAHDEEDSFAQVFPIGAPAMHGAWSVRFDLESMARGVDDLQAPSVWVASPKNQPESRYGAVASNIQAKRRALQQRERNIIERERALAEKERRVEQHRRDVFARRHQLEEDARELEARVDELGEQLASERRSPRAKREARPEDAQQRRHAQWRLMGPPASAATAKKWYQDHTHGILREVVRCWWLQAVRQILRRKQEEHSKQMTLANRRIKGQVSGIIPRNMEAMRQIAGTANNIASNFFGRMSREGLSYIMRVWLRAAAENASRRRLYMVRVEADRRIDAIKAESQGVRLTDVLQQSILDVVLVTMRQELVLDLFHAWSAMALEEGHAKRVIAARKEVGQRKGEAWEAHVKRIRHRGPSDDSQLAHPGEFVSNYIASAWNRSGEEEFTSRAGAMGIRPPPAGSRTQPGPMQERRGLPSATGSRRAAALSEMEEEFATSDHRHPARFNRTLPRQPRASLMTSASDRGSIILEIRRLAQEMRESTEEALEQRFANEKAVAHAESRAAASEAVRAQLEARLAELEDQEADMQATAALMEEHKRELAKWAADAGSFAWRGWNTWSLDRFLLRTQTFILLDVVQEWRWEVERKKREKVAEIARAEVLVAVEEQKQQDKFRVRRFVAFWNSKSEEQDQALMKAWLRTGLRLWHAAAARTGALRQHEKDTMARIAVEKSKRKADLLQVLASEAIFASHVVLLSWHRVSIEERFLRKVGALKQSHSEHRVQLLKQVRAKVEYIMNAYAQRSNTRLMQAILAHCVSHWYDEVRHLVFVRKAGAHLKESEELYEEDIERLLYSQAGRTDVLTRRLYHVRNAVDDFLLVQYVFRIFEAHARGEQAKHFVEDSQRQHEEQLALLVHAQERDRTLIKEERALYCSRHSRKAVVAKFFFLWSDAAAAIKTQRAHDLVAAATQSRLDAATAKLTAIMSKHAGDAGRILARRVHNEWTIILFYAWFKVARRTATGRAANQLQEKSRQDFVEEKRRAFMQTDELTAKLHQELDRVGWWGYMQMLFVEWERATRAQTSFRKIDEALARQKDKREYWWREREDLLMGQCAEACRRAAFMLERKHVEESVRAVFRGWREGLLRDRYTEAVESFHAQHLQLRRRLEADAEVQKSKFLKRFDRMSHWVSLLQRKMERSFILAVVVHFWYSGILVPPAKHRQVCEGVYEDTRRKGRTRAFHLAERVIRTRDLQLLLRVHVVWRLLAEDQRLQETHRQHLVALEAQKSRAVDQVARGIFVRLPRYFEAHAYEYDVLFAMMCAVAWRGWAKANSGWKNMSRLEQQVAHSRQALWHANERRASMLSKVPRRLLQLRAVMSLVFAVLARRIENEFAEAATRQYQIYFAERKQSEKAMARERRFVLEMVSDFQTSLGLRRWAAQWKAMAMYVWGEFVEASKANRADEKKQIHAREQSQRLRKAARLGCWTVSSCLTTCSRSRPNATLQHVHTRRLKQVYDLLDESYDRHQRFAHWMYECGVVFMAMRALSSWRLFITTQAYEKHLDRIEQDTVHRVASSRHQASMEKKTYGWKAAYSLARMHSLSSVQEVFSAWFRVVSKERLDHTLETEQRRLRATLDRHKLESNDSFRRMKSQLHGRWKDAVLKTTRVGSAALSTRAFVIWSMVVRAREWTGTDYAEMQADLRQRREEVVGSGILTQLPQLRSQAYGQDVPQLAWVHPATAGPPPPGPGGASPRTPQAPPTPPASEAVLNTLHRLARAQELCSASAGGAGRRAPAAYGDVEDATYSGEEDEYERGR